MFKTYRRYVESPSLAVVGLSFILAAMGSTKIASAQPGYLNVAGTSGQTSWNQTPNDPPGFNWYGGTNMCWAYNPDGNPLFGTIATLGVEVEVATGNFTGVFVPPPTTWIESLAQQNASGAWWQVYGGPIWGVSSGTTSNGFNYRELRVYTGFALYQIQGAGTGGWWNAPALLARYWLTQTITITQGGSGMSSCSGSRSAPPGCEQCNN